MVGTPRLALKSGRSLVEAGAWAVLVEQCELQESSAFSSSATTNRPLRLLFEVAAVARRGVVILSLPVASRASARTGSNRTGWPGSYRVLHVVTPNPGFLP